MIDWKLAGPASLLGVFLLANGIYMLVAPESWYWTVTGVADRGAFNQHFIRDIGIVYALTSVGLIIGGFSPGQRFAYWLPPFLWLGGHALFHIWEVIVGVCGPEALIEDFVGVTMPAIIVAVMIWFARNEPKTA